ncbi:hypothetical protein HY031_01335 [Candidatus Gottesmanbacteria bacterium]|nr:hypothetical protein [Candidatus Gottesmanbacteria bacterium]
MQRVFQVFTRKPFLFVLFSLAYLLVVGLLKWWFKPPVASLMFLGGGFVGIYFLDLAELFFNLTPSPFRSVLFLGLFAIVSFFVVTSSGSLLASGLVLSIFLTMIFWQAGEWQVNGNLDSWFRMVSSPMGRDIPRWMLIGCIVLFLLETYFFIR